MAGMREGNGGEDRLSCVALWLDALADRDGAVDVGIVGARATKKFLQPTIRFAVLGDEPRGFALTVAPPTTTTQTDNIGQSARIELLAVKPGLGGNGYGRALLLDAIDHARAAGFTRIDLEVRHGNGAALALYTSTGFKPCGEPQQHPLGGESMLTLALDLT